MRVASCDRSMASWLMATLPSRLTLTTIWSVVVGVELGAVAAHRHHLELARVLLLLMMRRFRQLDLDAAVEHGRDHHEDDEEHQHHVDQRRNVDLRAHAAGADVAGAPLVDVGPLSLLPGARLWRGGGHLTWCRAPRAAHS